MKTEYILGINGWFKRTHDASACLLRNGELVAMAEEERFIRSKHAFGKVPYNAIAYCLKKARITLDDVEIIGVGWNFKRLYGNAGVEEPKLNDLAEVYFPKKYFKYKKQPRIELVDHHLAHAASTYYFSGFKEATIITLDGQGEDDSGSVALGKSGNIFILKKFPIKDSLGFFYDAITQYLGFDFMDAGKTMGLASYGLPIYKFSEIELTTDGYKININPRAKISIKNKPTLDKEEIVSDTWLRLLPRMGNRNIPRVTFDLTSSRLREDLNLIQRHKNIASSAQKILEETVLHLVAVAVRKTGCKNLCLSGGVALNCMLNGEIVKSGLVDKVFVPPFPNDIGVSVGAALLLSKNKPKKALKSASWGPEFTNREIKKVLDKYSIRYKKVNNIAKVTAKLIFRGKIVSWFQGRMEIGPRALGNRSILGNPCLPKTHDKLNEAKDRENWRPLAPSFIAQEMDKYLEKSVFSPFMVVGFNVKKQFYKKLPALVHVDGTTRPQSVLKETNQKYYNLISEFKKLSGFPVIMNTSFNGKGEPIVCNPIDAIKSFYSNKTDYLAIGDFIISK